MAVEIQNQKMADKDESLLIQGVGGRGYIQLLLQHRMERELMEFPRQKLDGRNEQAAARLGAYRKVIGTRKLRILGTFRLLLGAGSLMLNDVFRTCTDRKRVSHTSLHFHHSSRHQQPWI